MTRTNTETQAVSANFDALAFELKHSQDYEQSQQFYVETDYEIDSDSDWCGSLYRVWKNCCLLGTFFQKQGKWVANPYYSNRRYLKVEESRDKTFSSNELAIRYILRCYEGSR